MLDVSEIFERARRHGVDLSVAGSKLRCKYRGSAPPGDIIELLREHRDSLIAHLSIHDLKQPSFARISDAETITPIPDYLWWFWYSIKIGNLGIGYTNGPRALLRTSGRVDQEDLVRGAAWLMNRHTVLAARTVAFGEREAFQCDVQPEQVCRVVDLRQAARETIDAAAQEAVDAFFWQPFDCTEAMFRILALNLPGDQVAIALVVHHFIADDQAVATIVRDLTRYLSEGTSWTHSEPEVLQYADYLSGMASWLASGGAADHARFWLDRMNGAPATNLRTLLGDYETVHKEEEIKFQVAAAKLGEFETRCHAAGATLLMGLLAVIHHGLASITGQVDNVLAVLTDGRFGPVPANSVGRYTNIVLLRAHLEKGADLSSALESIRAEFVASLSHWICPYEVIYHELARIGGAHDAPTVSFRDARSMAALPSQHSSESPLTDLSRLRAPPGRSGQGSAYSNFDVTFARTHEGLFARIAFLPMIHDVEKVRTLAQAIEAACSGEPRLHDLPHSPLRN